MRSTKYHDYRAIKIALFIILVILGLFIYIKCTRALHEHTATQWTTITEATCTEDGLEAKICTDPECKGEQFDERVIPATGHNGKWETVKKATCTEQGTECNICTVCSKILDTKYTDPNGHKEVTDNAVEPTCYSTGLTEGKHCGVCNATLVKQETVATINHTTGEYFVTKEPTCTETGSKVKLCTECNQQIADTKVEIPVIDHKYVVLPETEVVISAPTCTKYGVTTMDAECTMCHDNMTIRFEDGIKPLGHNYTAWELVYDSEKGEFAMVGTCDCDEEGNVVILGTNDGLELQLDTSVPNCCVNKYIGTIVDPNSGEKITKEVIISSEAHKLEKVYVLDNGEMKVAYAPITENKKYDEEYGIYYQLPLEGLVYYESENNQWDENGFAWGAFECVLCKDEVCEVCNGDYWYIVRIYDPKYDTRLSGESVDN